MASHKNAFDRRSISVAVVSFADPAKLARYQEQHRWPFMIFADPKRQAYQRFALRRLSLGRVFSMATLTLYFKLLREGMRRKDYGREDIYQGGGDFLLDREGNILFAHRSQNPADRPSIETLLGEIDRVAMQAR